ncbi:MAG TPA: SET domain-containing protein-lysine N-methyltransferase, partial [Sedimentisphaerales bacterium]|nr:SET domain-containing protein-lysine N-methyltransferase [Sedimentisphaerales bacterium]
FANEPIKKKKFILEYSGELISDQEADRRGGRYLFKINSRWTVDGRNRDNLSRYINHSCKPNCEVETQGKKILISSIKITSQIQFSHLGCRLSAFIYPHYFFSFPACFNRESNANKKSLRSHEKNGGLYLPINTA